MRSPSSWKEWEAHVCQLLVQLQMDGIHPTISLKDRWIYIYIYIWMSSPIGASMDEEFVQPRLITSFQEWAFRKSYSRDKNKGPSNYSYLSPRSVDKTSCCKKVARSSACFCFSSRSSSLNKESALWQERTKEKENISLDFQSYLCGIWQQWTP